MDCNKEEANSVPKAQMPPSDQVKWPLNEKQMPIKKRVWRMDAVSGIDDDDKIVNKGEGFDLPKELNAGIRCPRCDLEITPNKLVRKGSSNVTNEKSEASLEGQNFKAVERASLSIHFEKGKEEKKLEGSDLFKDSSADVNDTKNNGEVVRTEKLNAEQSEIHNMKKKDYEYVELSNIRLYEFHKDRFKKYFLHEHLWAIYDSMDGMPRLYAQIRKVFSPGFKVMITWLEPNPDYKDEIDWVNGYLPVSCGKFKHGNTETTEEFNIFSHPVIDVKGTDIGLFEIYPRKAETWALFKEWGLTWGAARNDHRNNEFEFVEILADYDKDSGINVGYLEKAEGFMSLFRPNKRVGSYQIPANELYRFSHRVPSYRTTGKERDGVPEGSYELDPASLPAYIVQDIKERLRNSQERQDCSVFIQNQPAVANFGRNSRTQSTSANPHQEHHLPKLNQPIFWTVCPFCNMKYQFHRDVRNRVLHCQNCMKPFIAYGLHFQDPASLPPYPVEDFSERSTFPNRRQNKSFPVQKQPGVSNGFGSISRMQSRGVILRHGQNQPGPYRPTFWTACPFCNRRHQYYQDISKRLVCQSCMKTFAAYPLKLHDLSSGPKRRRV